MEFDSPEGERWEISEWWDHSGDYHFGPPTEEQLLDEAVQITGHITTDGGDDLYFTAFSDDGWDADEIHSDFDDADSHYLG